MHMPRSESTKLVLDTTRLQQEIHAHGFASLKDFADSVGVHRNTVGNYLSGKTALPDGLARILEALDLEPSEVLSLSVLRRHVPGLAVAGLIGSLHAAAHDAALVLFGSRAQGTAKRYSDYDIGVFRSEGLDFPTFSRLLDLVGEWNQESLLRAQLVDLTRADGPFLDSLAGDLQFLAGCHAAWRDLLRKAGMQLYE